MSPEERNHRLDICNKLKEKASFGVRLWFFKWKAAIEKKQAWIWAEDHSGLDLTIFFLIFQTGSFIESRVTPETAVRDSQQP